MHQINRGHRRIIGNGQMQCQLVGSQFQHIAQNGDAPPFGDPANIVTRGAGRQNCQCG